MLTSDNITSIKLQQFTLWNRNSVNVVNVTIWGVWVPCTSYLNWPFLTQWHSRTTLYCTIPQFAKLNYTALRHATLHFKTLHPTTLHCPALHPITLHCSACISSALHYTTLHYTALNSLHHLTSQQSALITFYPGLSTPPLFSQSLLTDIPL